MTGYAAGPPAGGADGMARAADEGVAGKADAARAAGDRATGVATDAGTDVAAVAPTLTVIEIAVIVIAVLMTIAAARVAQPILVPVVAGLLVSYTLRPAVSLLERARVPRVAAAALVIAVLVGLISATGYAIRDDVNDAVAELPSAARKLRLAAVQSARESPGPISRVKEAAAELDRAAQEASGVPAAAASAVPLATGVEAQFQRFVTQESNNAVAVASQLLVALLLAFFLLAAGDTFRRKVTRIAGASLSRRRVTVEVLNEIDDQIQAYMLTLLVANVLIALATWGALWLLHVPNAGMWAAGTGVLHFIPYAGTAIAAAAVGVAAFVASGSLGDGMLAAATIFGIAVVIGMGLTTWLQGRVARMNPVAVFIGVLFFGWLWGGWGLLLGMPILAVLKSVADRVASLHAVSELLGA